MVDFFFRVRCERGVRAVRCQAGSKGRERPHLTVQEAEDISLGSSGGRSARPNLFAFLHVGQIVSK